MQAVDFQTGSGFNYTVLPDRGMDISYAEYQGIPLCWRSGTGDAAPAYYDSEGSEWLRGFAGGLLTTCGMTYLGDPEEDQGQKLGLHGRVAYLPADNIWVDSRWEGDRYTMWVQGKVSEVKALGPHLLRTRRISTELGVARLNIEDVIENVDYKESPLMYLFHINVGFPIVDDGSEFISNSTKVIPRDDRAEEGLDSYNKCPPPTAGFAEQVFYHEMAVDQDNHVYVAIVNRSFGNGRGIGLYVKYHKTQLPRFVQWKMMDERGYVIGLEPANCWVDGRTKERQRGTLDYLEPGGRRHYEVEIGVLTSNQEIDIFSSKVKNNLE
ncbi:MAG: aldose 1-epimerase family protein [Candidatus Poribacteria bacterium]